jgi:transcriptional regulator with XRE-family HTH domain
MELKDLIRLKREELGLTMKELAKKVGVSEATISRWESGDIEKIRRGKIQALASAIGVNPVELLGYEITIDTNKRDKRYDLTQEEGVLIESFRTADETTREMVRRLLAYSDQLKK